MMLPMQQEMNCDEEFRIRRRRRMENPPMYDILNYRPDQKTNNKKHRQENSRYSSLCNINFIHIIPFHACDHKAVIGGITFYITYTLFMESGFSILRV